MMPKKHEAAIRSLDARYAKMENPNLWARPPKGWIRAIRDSLGMTTQQLAKRLDMSQSRVIAIEKAEQAGTLKLNTLERAADALGCQLVYTLMPKESLADTLRHRAEAKARDLML